MKYMNPNSWCRYPHVPGDPLAYCWSYAHFVDGTLACEGKEVRTMAELRNFCSRCEYYKEPTENIERYLKKKQEKWAQPLRRKDGKVELERYE